MASRCCSRCSGTGTGVAAAPASCAYCSRVWHSWAVPAARVSEPQRGGGPAGADNQPGPAAAGAAAAAAGSCWRGAGCCFLALSLTARCCSLLLPTRGVGPPLNAIPPEAWRIAERIQELPAAAAIDQLTVYEYACGVGISPHVGE